MHHHEILNRYLTCEWFISLYCRWVENSYHKSWAHLLYLSEGSSVHTQTHIHLLTKVFFKACETDRWFSEWYKKSNSKDTEKMGGPVWADSVFTTWKRVTHIPAYTLYACTTNTLTNNTRFPFKLSYSLTTACCAFHNPLCITTSKYQFIYMVELKTGCRGWTQSHQQKPAQRYAESTQVKCFLMALFAILSLSLIAASL